MAELFDNGCTYPFDPDCYIGGRGDLVVPIDNSKENDEPGIFITLSPFEAKSLAEKLFSTIDKYKKELDVA